MHMFLDVLIVTVDNFFLLHYMSHPSDFAFVFIAT